jgi:hypothetical protein
MRHERPLTPPAWERLVLETARDFLIVKNTRFGGGWVRCTDVQLDGAYPTTGLVVTLHGSRSGHPDERGSHRFELYRPLFLWAPDGRLHSAADRASGIVQYLEERFTMVLRDSRSGFVEDCRLICGWVFDILGDRLGVRLIDLPRTEDRVELAYVAGDRRYDQILECFDGERRRGTWELAEELRELLERQTRSAPPEPDPEAR